MSVDIRGIGASAKPLEGFDKKTMAADNASLIDRLGHSRAHVVGHDIGAQVAHSLAANFPGATETLTMQDVPQPDEGLPKWPPLPTHGTFSDKIDDDHAYARWFAFHQVKNLPEELLESRVYIEQEWIFRYLMKDESAIDTRDRAVYAAAYATKDASRAGSASHQAFAQDIIDEQGYAMIEIPVPRIAGPCHN